MTATTTKGIVVEDLVHILYGQQRLSESSGKVLDEGTLSKSRAEIERSVRVNVAFAARDIAESMHDTPNDPRLEQARQGLSFDFLATRAPRVKETVGENRF